MILTLLFNMYRFNSSCYSKFGEERHWSCFCWR